MSGRIWHRVTTACFIPLALSACTSGPKDYVGYQSQFDPASVIRRVTENIGKCWFESGHPAFERLIYTPERNANVSRVLLVAKDAPGGLPQLIVTAQPDGRRTDIRVFGPLLASAEGKRIEADVNRWAGGVSGCG